MSLCVGGIGGIKVIIILSCYINFLAYTCNIIYCLISSRTTKFSQEQWNDKGEDDKRNIFRILSEHDILLTCDFFFRLFSENNSKTASNRKAARTAWIPQFIKFTFLHSDFNNFLCGEIMEIKTPHKNKIHSALNFEGYSENSCKSNPV